MFAPLSKGSGDFFYLRNFTLCFSMSPTRPNVRGNMSKELMKSREKFINKFRIFMLEMKDEDVKGEDFLACLMEECVLGCIIGGLDKKTFVNSFNLIWESTETMLKDAKLDLGNTNE